MPRIRFSIAKLMVLVLLVACNLGFLRLLFSVMGPPGVRQFFELMLVGFLPMANILAIALLIGFDRRSAPAVLAPGLVRFERCGWAVLLFNVICFGLFCSALHDALGKWAGSIAPAGNSPFSAIVFFAVVVVTCLLPTLAATFAACQLMAGYRIRIVIERPDATAGNRSGDRLNRATHGSTEISNGSSAG